MAKRIERYSASDCFGLKYIPQMIRSGLIGSRKSQTVVYFHGNQTLVICGCWEGNLGEFEERVEKTHAKGGKYYNEYMRFIKRVKAYIND